MKFTKSGKAVKSVPSQVIEQIKQELTRDEKGKFLLNNKAGQKYTTEELRVIAYMLNKILYEHEDILYQGSLFSKFNQLYGTTLNRGNMDVLYQRLENEIEEYKLNEPEAAKVAASALEFFKNVDYQIEARQAERALNNKTNAIYTMFLQKAMDRDHFDDKAALSQGQNIFNIQSVTVKPVLPANEDSDK